MQNYLVAGVDEVGRGCLAGEVVAAAVILDANVDIAGLQDSKKISEAKRLVLSDTIKSKSLAYAIATASVAEIDKLNILQATMLAMTRAVALLNIKPNKVLVDGNKCPDLPIPCEAIVGGDGLIACISAASIIAKVFRDNHLIQMHKQHPQYSFDQHKGYPTKLHLQKIKEHGISLHHRTSFKPIKNYIIHEIK